MSNFWKDYVRLPIICNSSSQSLLVFIVESSWLQDHEIQNQIGLSGSSGLPGFSGLSWLSGLSGLSRLSGLSGLSGLETCVRL